MLFTQKDIHSSFSADQLEQAQEIIKTGQAKVSNLQRGGELVTGMITRDRPALRVYIRTKKVNSAVSIQGECSCAKKTNCEHVAAILLQTLQTTDISHRQSPPNNPVKPSTSQQVLCYIIKFAENNLQVKPHLARSLKHNNFALGQYYEPSQTRDRILPRFLTAIDVELLNSLSELPRHSTTGTPQLSGQNTSQLLATLIASERCFYDEPLSNKQLKLGPMHKFDCHWHADKHGNQRITWHTPSSDNKLLSTLDSLWYFDSEQAVCGKLATQLPPKLIQELLNCPPVTPEQVDKLTAQLTQAWPNTALPSLQQFDIETLPACTPQPRLCLSSKNNINHAHLSFDYGKLTLSLQEPNTHLINGKLKRVQRNKTAEQTAIEQLSQAGLFMTKHHDASFSPNSNKAESWINFQLTELPTLQNLGWHIDYDHFRHHITEVKQWHGEANKLDKQDWFSITLGVEVEGEKIDLLPILLGFLTRFASGLPDKKSMASEHFLVPYKTQNKSHRLLKLPVSRILPLLETLLEINNKADAAVIKCSRIQLAHFSALGMNEEAPYFKWLSQDDTAELLVQLRESNGIAEIKPPKGLQAKLRPYQQQGLNWLQFLRQYQFAGILADDMGLGKTIQALAHLLLEKETGRATLPSLVIAPTSLMTNWRQEAGKFTPQLNVLVLHGPHRKANFKNITKYDLVITTYPLLVRDQNILLTQDFHLLMLDEAQVIKNPKSQAARTSRKINARHRLCLTGTPMENHLGELWSLFDFLLPGLLGSNKQFQQHFRLPIEKDHDETAAERLSHRIRPFLLRRTKNEVATELPPKTEITQTVIMDNAQRELYETVRLTMHGRIQAEIKRQGLARSHISVLDALLKLRQVCCDPRLVNSDNIQQTTKSAKLEALTEMLPEMIEEGRRILIFSQFTTMLGYIEETLKTLDIQYAKLTGKTRDRQVPIERFQAGEVPVFLISLKAGGVGLNLTTADTVIHYDPWWNPAVERQATDRAHRIGQKQAVFVYKLICEGTLEEKIQAMQQRKQTLADGLYQGKNQEPQWNAQDLESLFEPLEPA